MDSKSTKVGRFLFDSITKGLYKQPLCVLREYIQNAADSIDKAVECGQLQKQKAVIKIDIDPSQLEQIIITDNGAGISEAEAEHTLGYIGSSIKHGSKYRGFRGIGRLGGLAYCSRLTFRTKAKGEAVETINTWDCDKLKEMVNRHSHIHRGANFQDVVEACSSFDTVSSKRVNESYFSVTMKNVQCAKDALKDVVRVRKYLREVAPVPFDFTIFPFGPEIDSYLREMVPSYDVYNILLNDEQVFKPYARSLPLTKAKTDAVDGFERVCIKDLRDKPMAYGWLAKRRDLVGAVLSSSGVNGIRVRVGNILLGGDSLLDSCFTQPRFNSYNVGELHIVNPDLTPNSDREAFEDGDARESFFAQFERQLGDSLSRKAQRASDIFNKEKVLARGEALVKEVKSQAGQGFVSNTHKDQALVDLRNTCEEAKGLAAKRNIPEETKERAQKLAKDIERQCSALFVKGNGDNSDDTIVEQLSKRFTQEERSVVGQVFEHLYALFGKYDTVHKLAFAIIKKMNDDRR